MKKSNIVIIIIAAATILAGQSIAVNRPQSRQDSPAIQFNQLLPAEANSPVLHGHASSIAERAETSRSQAWQRFLRKSGRWTTRWNRHSGTPGFASGRPLVISPRPLTSANIEAACRGFVRTHSDLFRIEPDSLSKLGTVKAGGRWYASFEQLYNGVPVLGSRVAMSFTKDDRLVSFSSEIYPDIKTDTTASIRETEAVTTALVDCGGLSHPADRIGKPKLYIAPIGNTDSARYRLCWLVEILQTKIPSRWRYIIDAQSGHIISKRDILWYELQGTVLGEYLPEFASDSPALAPFPYLRISAEGEELPIYLWNMDSDPGWQTEGAWAFGQPLGGGSHCGDPTSGATGTNVYGYNLAGNYPNFMSAKYLTTTAIDCSGLTGLRLKFKRWLGVEGYGWDEAFVEVSNNGTDWLRVWESLGDAICDGQWVSVQYDISEVADNQPTVFIRWGMGPTDQAITYPGWNIDDVEIVSVQGGTYRTLTQIDGIYEIFLPWQPSLVLSELAGLYADINFAAGNDARFAIWQMYSDILNWVWDASLCSVRDESNMYYHVNRVHDYYKKLDPSFDGLDYPVPCWVYVGFSNAYWDGYNMVFGRGDGVDWDNFSLYAEVIYHEYTHGVTDKIYTGASLPYYAESGAMNEGWSDYFGCLLTPSQNHFMGDGGLLKDEPNGFRSLVNTFRRETDWVNEVHYDSQVFAGSLWQARTVVGGEVMDELVHFARYAHTTTFEDYLTALLLEDDVRYGDSDLSNGTPHGQAIFTAFGDHGIGGLQFQAGSLNIDDTSGNNDGYAGPGESVGLSLTLINAWADATNIHATLTTEDPFVTVTKPESVFPIAAFGETTDNSSNPFILQVDANCPQTHTIRLKLEISAAGPYPYHRTCLLYCNVAIRQFCYDDGEADDWVSFGTAGGGLAVKVTPDKYPCYPTAVRLYPVLQTQITVTIWGQSPSGGLGPVLGSVVAYPPAIEDWFDVDISQFGLVITEGSIYVGWTEGEGSYGNGFDYDPPYYQRSVVTYNGNLWPLEFFGYLGNFMIRLRYSIEPPLAINPPYEYISCPNHPTSVCLEAANGTPPYNWSVIPLAPDYQYFLPGIGELPVVGAPQGLNGDEVMMRYTLPFTFPYYGRQYTEIGICENGYLDLADGPPRFSNSAQLLKDSAIIAPLWDDLTTFEPDDVYIDESVPGDVTIRWEGHTWSTGQPVSFAVLLSNNGLIRFDYGPGNTTLTPTIGISAGDSQRYILVPGYDGVANLGNAPSVMFFPRPQRSPLPSGIQLDTYTGCLVGQTTATGSYTATIAVTDSSSPPQTTSRQFTLLAGYRQGDINSNCAADFYDFAVLAESWLKTGCNTTNNWCSHADIDHSGTVSYDDLVTFAQDWLVFF